VLKYPDDDRNVDGIIHARCGPEDSNPFTSGEKL
jgi:hypothetical protein